MIKRGGEVDVRTGSKADILRRLECAEGHTRGVHRMVAEGVDSLAVLGQVKALQGALNKVTMLVVLEHLVDLMVSNPGDQDPAQREKALADIAGVLTALHGG